MHSLHSNEFQSNETDSTIILLRRICIRRNRSCGTDTMAANLPNHFKIRQRKIINEFQKAIQKAIQIPMKPDGTPYRTFFDRLIIYISTTV